MRTRRPRGAGRPLGRGAAESGREDSRRPGARVAGLARDHGEDQPPAVLERRCAGERLRPRFRLGGGRRGRPGLRRPRAVRWPAPSPCPGGRASGPTDIARGALARRGATNPPAPKSWPDVPRLAVPGVGGGDAWGRPLPAVECSDSRRVSGQHRPLSPGARSPLGFCRAARGWSRARLSYLFSQCSFGIFATIARIIRYKLTGNSFIVGQGFFLKATSPRQLLTLASQPFFRGIFSLARQLCRIYTGSRFSTPGTTGGAPQVFAFPNREGSA